MSVRGETISKRLLVSGGGGGRALLERRGGGGPGGRGAGGKGSPPPAPMKIKAMPWGGGGGLGGPRSPRYRPALLSPARLQVCGLRPWLRTATCVQPWARPWAEEWPFVKGGGRGRGVNPPSGTPPPPDTSAIPLPLWHDRWCTRQGLRWAGASATSSPRRLPSQADAQASHRVRSPTPLSGRVAGTSRGRRVRDPPLPKGSARVPLRPGPLQRPIPSGTAVSRHAPPPPLPTPRPMSRPPPLRKRSPHAPRGSREGLNALTTTSSAEGVPPPPHFPLPNSRPPPPV